MPGSGEPTAGRGRGVDTTGRRYGPPTRPTDASVLAAIPSPPDSTLDIGPLELHYYGIVIAIGVALAFGITRRRYERVGGDGELVDRVMVWTVLVGFLGARAGYVATHLDRFFGPDAPLDPWQVIAIWEGGLAFFGGIAAGAITAVVLLRRYEQPVLPFFDAVAVAVPTAQAIGRLGNWFNQELFGGPTDLPWGLEIDPARRPAGFEQFETFHPTFLYEAILNLLAVALILRLERRREWRMGSIFLVYLACYGAIRFLMELLRTDEQIEWFGLGIRNNGWIALIVLVVSLVLLARRELGDGPDPLAAQVARDQALLDATHTATPDDSDDTGSPADEPAEPTPDDHAAVTADEHAEVDDSDTEPAEEAPADR